MSLVITIKQTFIFNEMYYFAACSDVLICSFLVCMNNQAYINTNMQFIVEKSDIYSYKLHII